MSFKSISSAIAGDIDIIDVCVVFVSVCLEIPTVFYELVLNFLGFFLTIWRWMITSYCCYALVIFHGVFASYGHGIFDNAYSCTINSYSVNRLIENFLKLLSYKDNHLLLSLSCSNFSPNFCIFELVMANLVQSTTTVFKWLI